MDTSFPFSLSFSLRAKKETRWSFALIRGGESIVKINDFLD